MEMFGQKQTDQIRIELSISGHTAESGTMQTADSHSHTFARRLKPIGSKA
jgi:hypothetical protein